ncbi:PKD-like family lipoprotein [Pinibacter soli]|uniref:PKD-like family lipoprotein n=1 Tax=Pinibacter soli TaxID=3044211 RepID=A0ABT6RDD2_9BACT|nr:PKD-like family lipoprotein [Pinibacter soli]MDI3320577.1 PKD-like family lipoprotein [Pinibacter soli]
MYIYKKTYWLIAITMLTMLGACYKDKGNYSYHDINEISVTLDSSYIATYGDKLSIKPILKLTMDTEANTYDTTRYSYEWSTLDAAALYASQRKILATTRDLNATVVIPPASSYTLYYRITDKKTGVQAQGTAKLSVVTSIYEGFLALCDVNGQSRLDMASYAKSAYTVIPDVLGYTGSQLPMTAKPVGVTYFFLAPLTNSSATKGIYISTNDGTNRIDPETFKWDLTMNIQTDMLSKVPSNFTADSFMPASDCSFMHSTAGNIYYYYRTYQLYFSSIINIVTGETDPFTASPFMAAAPTQTSLYGMVLYDTKNKRFLRHVPGATSCSPMPTSMPLFNYKTGMDLVYMEWTPYNGGEVMAVLRNVEAGKTYIAKFTLASAVNQTYYAEITATDFDKAEKFAVSPDFSYLFYNVGGKVYEYDLGLKQSILMINQAKPVTLLKFQHFFSGAYTSGTAGKQVLYNKLIVASHDGVSATSGGTLDFYNVPQANGQLTLFQSLTGFGKIKDLTYRER